MVPSDPYGFESAGAGWPGHYRPNLLSRSCCIFSRNVVVCTHTLPLDTDTIRPTALPPRNVVLGVKPNPAHPQFEYLNVGLGQGEEEGE